MEVLCSKLRGTSKVKSSTLWHSFRNSTYTLANHSVRFRSEFEISIETVSNPKRDKDYYSIQAAKCSICDGGPQLCHHHHHHLSKHTHTHTHHTRQQQSKSIDHTRIFWCHNCRIQQKKAPIYAPDYREFVWHDSKNEKMEDHTTVKTTLTVMLKK